MLDLHSRLAQLKRPALLSRAARFGVDDYRRDSHLRRLFQTDNLPRTAEALMRLLDMENEINTARTVGDGSYSAARHVDILTAIAGEARLFYAVRPRAID